MFGHQPSPSRRRLISPARWHRDNVARTQLEQYASWVQRPVISVADIPFYLLRLNIGTDLARFVCWSVCVCLCVCWSQPRALQKRMKRSRCPLESGVRWTQRKLVTRILPRDGTLLGDMLRHARTWSIFSNLFAKGSSDASAGYITVATCFKVELEIMSICYKLR